MADLRAVDVTVKQSLGGVMVESVITMQVVRVDPINIAFLELFATEFEANIIPALNGIQVSGVANVGLSYQARGVGGTPLLDRGLAGTGMFPSQPDVYMPPEFAYWVRWYVGDTYDAIGGAQNTVKPIRRGGIFVAGTADTQLANAQFVPSLLLSGNFGEFVSALITGFEVGTEQCVGAVLAENPTGVPGWRIANITDGSLRYITRLRSRKA